MPEESITNFLGRLYISESMPSYSTSSIKEDDKKEEKFGLVITGSTGPKADLVSGGEFTRLRLAVDLALGLLCLARSDSAPDFVCLDEIFAPVDESGKELMFEILEKLQEYFRMIIVISHDRMIKERIKNTIIVNKVNDISQIEQQAFEEAK